ncbi:hypothetical protein AVEN_206042-1 [Araneus ventricosus]|uniref:Uncharacterized protein n=1 Tax=Araneus ventricosus TaxID=182803 RepID=A0A4Y2VIV2_ARAVE|nr:hypothetical protein AVEN_206042-1 [Araneus ventricosus]
MGRLGSVKSGRAVTLYKSRGRHAASHKCHELERLISFLKEARNKETVSDLPKKKKKATKNADTNELFSEILLQDQASTRAFNSESSTRAIYQIPPNIQFIQ